MPNRLRVEDFLDRELEQRGVVFGAKVMTFPQLIEELALELRHGKRVIGAIGERLVLEQVLHEHIKNKEKVSYFSRLQETSLAGLAKGLGEFIRELKQAMVSPSDFITSIKKMKIGNKDIKVETILEGVRRFELTQNGKMIFVQKGSDYFVVEAVPRKISDLGKSKVDLANLSFSLDVKEDLRQLFIDAWRMERDYFWDPGMHGLDWDAMLDKYLPLVDRVTTRRELNDLIGELMGELSALHVSVRGGDLRQGADQVRVASLGARLVRDEAAGGFRIDYIYQSDPDYPDELSPLADPDLDIREGDVIVSINGRETLSVRHPNALLRNQGGQQVLIDLKSGKGGTERRAVVVPMGNDSGLRYSDWEYSRRLKVEEDGAGEIGYVHLRAMGGGNITEWYRNFYPVFNRKGLIIDVRHNRGGNIDAFILEKLMRKAWFFWKDRGRKKSL